MDQKQQAEFLAWKAERDKRERERGAWWLTAEGRATIRETWDDPEDGNLALPLLNALEAAEQSSRAGWDHAKECDDARKEAEERIENLKRIASRNTVQVANLADCLEAAEGQLSRAVELLNRAVTWTESPQAVLYNGELWIEIEAFLSEVKAPCAEGNHRGSKS